MNIPQHIAIILDGNGRWAKAKGMPRSYGHKVGCENLENICYDIKEIGVKYLTVYAFSTENWERSQEEVGYLMFLFRGYLKRCKNIARDNNMRMVIIGDKSGFPEDMQKQMYELEEYSAQFDGILLQIALNYGSRDELRRGVQKIAEEVKNGTLSVEEIDEACISNHLDTAGVPDPDLMIRTSGEQRLSNYLMWQLAYAEFYFTDVPWPDFHKAELIEAIEWYNKRDRRFGGVKEEKNV